MGTIFGKSEIACIYFERTNDMEAKKIKTTYTSTTTATPTTAFTSRFPFKLKCLI